MSAALTDTIRQRLVSLKMPFAMEALEDVVRRLENGQISALEAIEALLTEELSFRETRRLKVALGTSNGIRIRECSFCVVRVTENVIHNQGVGAKTEKVADGA